MLKPESRLDLHMHTCRSDGRWSTAELLSRCAKGELDVVALTDHDLEPEIPSGPTLVDGRSIHVVHGAEISTMHEGTEQHLLVYFQGEMPTEFRTFCRELSIKRAERYTRAVANLGLPGLPPADEEAWAGRRSLTRWHLSHALVEAGHAKDLGEAFRRFSGEEARKVPDVEISMVQAITVARALGGVTSWAHPDPGQAARWAPALAKVGLQALEGNRPHMGNPSRNGFKRLAKKLGLMLTGGSDTHGWWNDIPGPFAVKAEQVEPWVRAVGLA